MKATKRLVFAIVALVCSVMLCAGVCLAWYSYNNRVHGNGMSNELDRGDIVKFEVKAHYLDFQSGENKQNYVIVQNGNMESSGARPAINVDNGTLGVLDTANDKMRPYTITGEYATAVLFEIDYTLKPNDKVYRIYANCPSDSALNVVKDNTDEFTSPLSNSVYLAVAGKSGTAYSATGTKTTFVESGNGKSYKVNYIQNINPSTGSSDNSIDDKGNFVGKSYILMDYDADLFTYLSSLVLEKDGSLNSRLTFGGDITIGIEVYEEGKEPKPVSITHVVDENTRTEQEKGVDVISSTWRFTVTYDDGSVRTVTTATAGVSVTNLDTSNLDPTKVSEEKTAKVTYTENGVSQDVNVTYTITHAHTYGGWSVTTAPTKTATGTATGSCTLCGQAQTLTLPVLTDSGYTITDNTATQSATGTGTYSIKVNGVTLSFTAATDKLPASSVSVTGVTLDKENVSLKMGATETAKLTATVLPENAANKGVEWSSSDTAVATVDDEGNITAIAAGEATITVTTYDGGFEATCSVHVAAAGTSSGTVTFTFLNDMPKNDKFTVTSGNIKEATCTVHAYGEEPLTKCLKMESSTSITSKLDQAMTLKLYFSTDGAVKIDGTAYNATTDANGDHVMSIDLAAGTHTITKDDSIFLFYVELIPKA